MIVATYLRFFEAEKDIESREVALTIENERCPGKLTRLLGFRPEVLQDFTDR